jgi:hypothetical protein
MMAFDIIAVAFLLASRPKSGEWLGPVGPLVAGTASVLAFGYIGLSLLGNPKHFLAALVGEPLIVEPLSVAVEPGKAGEQRSFDVSLTNLTHHPIRVVGGTNTCSCITTDSLPLVIPPGTHADVAVRMRLLGSPGYFVHQYELYTDAPGRGIITAHIYGSIHE